MTTSHAPCPQSSVWLGWWMRSQITPWSVLRARVAGTVRVYQPPSSFSSKRENLEVLPGHMWLREIVFPSLICSYLWSCGQVLADGMQVK